MSRRERVSGIVLRTYDVGDADRFCILLTRERGRLSARARAVRKPGSHMGGALLPMQRVTLELTETGAGMLITSATLLETEDRNAPTLQSFAAAMEGTELILALLEDEESLPEIYDALDAFITECSGTEPREAVIAFTFRLLTFLGLLPEPAHLSQFAPCSTEERDYVDAVSRGIATSVPPESVARLTELKNVLLRDHLRSPLKVPAAVAQY